MTLWTVAHQAPLSVEFSRQEYWSGLPFPPPRDLPNPGIEPASLVSPALAGRFFTAEPPGKPIIVYEASNISNLAPRNSLCIGVFSYNLKNIESLKKLFSFFFFEVLPPVNM